MLAVCQACHRMIGVDGDVPDKCKCGKRAWVTFTQPRLITDELTLSEADKKFLKSIKIAV